MNLLPDELVFLGTGTSYGVPMIGCGCEVCRSDDPRNRRSRCSALLNAAGSLVLIDVTPDFRTQALREGIDRLDGVVITHAHADHVFGLDDLRPLSLARDEPLPVYADAAACAELRTMFGYVFRTEEKRLGIPWLALREMEDGVPFRIGEAELAPFRVKHGRGWTSGVRCGGFAYLTDVKELPESAWRTLDGVDVLALDLLREEPHPTHLSRAESLAVWERLGRPRTHFIHMGHEIDHGPFDAGLPEGSSLAYDGLRIPLRARP